MIAPLIINNEQTNYLIDTEGQIYNKNTNKILTGTIRSGYRMVKLTINKVKKDYSVHRLVAQTFIDNPNNLPIVNHKDRNKLNNNINNLEWVSQSDNMLHAYNNGIKFKNRQKIQPIENEIIDEEHGWKQYKNTNYWGNKKGKIVNIKTKKYLNFKLNNDGYCVYYLYIDKKRYNKLAHRLIYEIFSEQEISSNIDINHIDGDKQNNQFDNLELVTRSENMRHSYNILKKNIKPVLQFDLNNNFIKEFPSVSEAARQIHALPSGITQACQQKIKTYYNFIWKYKKV